MKQLCVDTEHHLMVCIWYWVLCCLFNRMCDFLSGETLNILQMLINFYVFRQKKKKKKETSQRAHAMLHYICCVLESKG